MANKNDTVSDHVQNVYKIILCLELQFVHFFTFSCEGPYHEAQEALAV